jgi:hypothetical protein
MFYPDEKFQTGGMMEARKKPWKLLYTFHREKGFSPTEKT